MKTTRVPTFFSGVTKIPDRISQKNQRLYSVSLFGFILCIISHFIYLILFFRLGVTLMYYYNYFSILVFGIGIYIVFRYEKYVLAGSVCALEIIFHNCLATFSVGFDAGFLYMLPAIVSIPFLMLPPNAVRAAFGVSMLSAIAFLASMIVLRGKTPIYVIPSAVSEILFVLNLLFMLSGLAVTAWLFVRYVKQAEDKANHEFERAESLLLNILPASIALRLKADPSTIADGFECVTVLFCDIVDFTKLAARLSPAEVVSVLNNLFSRFDLVAESYGLEKIKTIGDAYMVASGIPERRDDHASFVADFALSILGEIRSFNAQTGFEVEMRIGINSGPVVAGVIGRKKFIYDLWGDAVNTASRMESHGLPGRIQVTKGSYELLKGNYEFEERGFVEIKGKGRVPAWLLTGRKPRSAETG
jgi:adenylate cyclase